MHVIMHNEVVLRKDILRSGEESRAESGPAQHCGVGAHQRSSEALESRQSCPMYPEL